MPCLRQSFGRWTAICSLRVNRFYNIHAPSVIAFPSPADLRRIVGRLALWRIRPLSLPSDAVFHFRRDSRPPSIAQSMFSRADRRTPAHFHAFSLCAPVPVFFHTTGRRPRRPEYLFYTLHIDPSNHPRNQPTVGMSKSTANKVTMIMTIDRQIANNPLIQRSFCAIDFLRSSIRAK